MTVKSNSMLNSDQENCRDWKSRYTRTNQEILSQTNLSNRSEGSVRLIAVSKQHPAEAVAEIARLGQRDFGENYVQESLRKIQSVNTLLESDTLPNPLCWHFIGHVQSRKCRDIAENFDWVHTIDSPKIARRLDSFRDQEATLQSLIQVNLQNESGKAGVSANELADLAGLIDSLSNLELRGLMIIPRPETSYDLQCEVFRELREILEKFQSCYPTMNQLSMGMSNDLAAAIHEGATMIRVGTAIFGPRTK